MWSLSSSDVVRSIITTSYKQSRHEDDLNQPLSVQPWGFDGYKRRYFLIEGLDDTHFRVYRESNYTELKRSWWSVASDINELKQLAEKLATEDGSRKAKELSGKIMAAIPRFEATEEVCLNRLDSTSRLTLYQKRKRREYRQARKQQFKRPEPNFSLYEGRTRGKRMKYTYSDDEDEGYSDTTTSRRSTRNTGTHTPAEGLAPTVTLSGRQVKSRQGGTYGESKLSGTHTPAVGGMDGTGEEAVNGENASGRPRRAAAANHGSNGWGQKGAHIEGYNSVDDMDTEEDDASEQDYGDDEEDDHVSLESDVNDQDDLTDVEDLEDEISDHPDKKKSLVVKLPVKTPTPERKITAKGSLTPQKEPVQQLDLKPTGKHDENQGGPSDLEPTGVISAANELDMKDSAQPASTCPTNNAAPSSEPSTEPMKIPTESSNPSPPSPLALRGSPEKPHNLPPSVDVGYGGS